jgi:dihydroxyacid dehydratase/phosphogluconate dehydratase
MNAETFDKSKPASRYVAAGVACAPQGDYPREGCLNVAGGTAKQNLEKVKLDKNQKVVRTVSTPISNLGGAVGLQGSLVLDGAIVKVAGMTTLQFRDPARALVGPIALVQSRDMISIDAGMRLGLHVPKAALAKRRGACKAPAKPYQSGVLREFADQAGPARKGPVVHAGGKAGHHLPCG